MLLPKLAETNFGMFVGGQRQRMLLVGITRATQWAYLSSVAGYEIAEINVLRQAGEKGHLFIKEGAVAASAPPSPPPFDVEEEDGGFL